MKTLVILLALIVGCLVSAAAHAGPIRTDVIYTNKLKFRIPFHYDNDELRRLGAKEIQLSVSRNRGQSWKYHQSVAPEAGKFNFEAPSDGEYWFIVRTVDAKNRLHPDAGQNEPGLQVIVDTAAPRLQLELKPIAPGKVQLFWTASDDHLDLSQLRIEYMQPGTPDWQPVSIVPSKSGQLDPWSVPHGGNVSVKGSVSDLARNVAHDQVTRAVAPGSQTVPRPASPLGRQPVAGSGTSPRNSQALSMSDEFPDSSRTGGKPSAGSAGRRSDPLPYTPLQASNDAPGPRSNFVSQHSDEFGEESMFPDNPPPREPAAPPAGAARRRVVNTRKFQMGYKLQDVDATGVDAVEFYITQDGGAQWYRYDVDTDRQSPMQIEVPQEGVYGFALGIRTTTGQSIDVPRLGDAPSLEVVVDQTPPRIELLPPELGRGRQAGRVLVQWKYADDFPAELPVALSYAMSPRGPWRKITDWSEHTGRYVWTVDATIPARFYLRITARDQAGNEQTAETLQPVLLELARPTARSVDGGSPN